MTEQDSGLERGSSPFDFGTNPAPLIHWSEERGLTVRADVLEALRAIVRDMAREELQAIRQAEGTR